MASRPSLSVRVVLVRPRNPLNIGAAARAMANFGLSDLAVVKPHAPVWRETVSAVGAERLVLKARRADTLDEVLRDRQIVLGTTAVRDRRLRRPLIRLPDLPAFLKENGARRVAVLFGSEKTGLSNAHLDRCTHILTIPTSPGCPSMNLGQAVAVCAYELARGGTDFGPLTPPG
ncbi:MAG: RNA methyltransferase [Elusimicrobiota bacterium]